MARGIIMEFFEFLIVTFNVVLCTHFYGALEGLLHSLFGTPSMIAGILSFFVFYLIFSCALWIIAGNLEAKANIPPSFGVNRMGGAFFGFIKGAVVIWWGLFFLSLVPMTKDSRELLHNSPTINTIQSMTPSIDNCLEFGGSARAYRVLHPWLMESVY